MRSTITILLAIIMQSICVNAQNYIGPAFTHTTAAGNITIHQTTLPTSKTGTTSGKKFLICHNYGIPNTSTQGIYFTGSTYNIYNEQTTNNMVANDKYNVVEPLPANGTTFVHTVNSANVTGGYLSTIDNPALNNNPNAIFFITKNFDGTTYDNSNLGIWYNTSSNKWTIYNESSAGSLITLGLTITVYVPNTNATVLTHRTTSANVDSYLTEIDNPLINGNPNAILFISHEYDNLGTVYLDAPTSVRYDASVGKWLIYSDDLSYIMPTNAKFNVLVAGEFPTAINNTNAKENENINTRLVGNNIQINSIGDAKIASVKCYNLSGAICASSQFNNTNTATINCQNLATGLYLVQTQTSKGVVNTKILIP